MPGALLAAWILVAAKATPGDHHVGSSLRCSECHVMHFSQSHGYQPTGGGSFVPIGIGPNPSLLRNRVNDLCLGCHDGMGLASDVLGSSNTGSQAGSVRLGGYLNRLGIEGLPATGHTLDALDAAPGSNPNWAPDDENGPGGGLACTNCHDPHGAPGSGHPTGSQYRNLRHDPGNEQDRWVTYNTAPGTNDLSRDVFLRQVIAYDEADVDWNEPNPFDSAIARWCGGCHNFVHGESLGAGGGTGPSGGLPEHPVFDDNLGTPELDQYNPLTNKVKVTSEIGIWNPAGPDVTPTCVTCHKGHGNGNPFGLIYRSGTGILTEDGDSNGTTVDHLCSQCHVQGSLFGASQQPLGG